MSAARMLTCGGCATAYDVSKRAPGKQVRCPRCQTVLTVPSPAMDQPGRDPRLSSSSRLRRAKGPSCRDHPRELAQGRCRACGADVCARCKAEPPIDHFCRACARERAIAGALPIDFGLLATPLLALRAMVSALWRMLAWNLGALVLVAAVFFPLILIGWAGWDPAAPAASDDLWRAARAQLFAGLVIAGAVACLVSYYALLVPAGCSVFLDAALRQKQVPFGDAIGDAWRRVARTGTSLLGVWVVMALVMAAGLLMALGVTYVAQQGLGTVPAVVALVVLATAVLLPGVALLGLAVPVVVLEERSALESLTRTWALARPRVWDVAILVVGWGALHLVFGAVLYAVRTHMGGWVVPMVLTLVGHVVDLVWPALLVATYHGLAAEEAGVVGRK